MIDIVITVIIIVYCSIIISLLWGPSKNNKTARYLAYATLGTLLWTFSILATVVDFSHERVIYWSRFSFFFPILIAFSLSQFNSSFISPQVKEKIYGPITKTMIYFLMAMGAIFSFISFTPLIIADVINLHSTFGPLQPVYSYLILFAFLLINIDLTRGYFLSEQKTRTQFGYVLLGVAISSIIGIITNLFVPMITHLEIRYLGPLGVVFFLTFTAYAIIKKKLFDIKTFVTGLFSTLLILSLVANVLYSRTILEAFLKSVILILAGYSSYRLIAYVGQETEQNLQINKLNKQLEKDKEELVELDRMKDEFLQMATHELNTPITVIKGRLSMAIDESMCHLDDEQKKFLAPVLTDTLRLASLSKDILNVARINQHRLKINAEEGDLDALLSSIVSGFEIRAKEKGNSIGYIRLERELPKLILDQSKIGEVISNLISNANKFTENGKIAVTSKIKDDVVIVSVADTGINIDKEDQKRLFEKFYQAGRFDPDNPQEQQGSGLGLYISKNIIELHGGKIWLESKKGEGATFYFSLPLEYKEIKQHEKIHSNGNGLRVL